MIKHNNSNKNFLKSLLTNELKEVNEDDLGKGFTLKPTEYQRYKGDSNTYCNLYKDDKKISDKVFRRGGLNSGFKKGDFCMLLVYGDDKIGINGTWCVINLKGEIIYKQKKSSNYPYLQGGVIIVEDSTYYNLLTGKAIVKGNKSIKSKSFIFVEVTTWNNEYEEGIYQIELATGKVKIFR